MADVEHTGNPLSCFCHHCKTARKNYIKAVSDMLNREVPLYTAFNHKPWACAVSCVGDMCSRCSDETEAEWQ